MTLIFLTLSSLGFAHMNIQHSLEARIVQVHGIAMTPSRSPIHATIEFVSGDDKTSVTTKITGSYSIDLHPQEYAITVTAEGICSRSFKRQFSVENAASPTDFILVDCSDCDLSDVDFATPAIEPDKPPELPPVLDASKFKYQKDQLEEVRLRPPFPEIFFGKRLEEEDEVIFRPLQCVKSSAPKPIVLNYRSMTLTSERLTYSKKTHTLHAKGNVVLYDNFQVEKFSDVQLMPDKDKFIVFDLQPKGK